MRKTLLIIISIPLLLFSCVLYDVVKAIIFIPIAILLLLFVGSISAIKGEFNTGEMVGFSQWFFLAGINFYLEVIR